MNLNIKFTCNTVKFHNQLYAIADFVIVNLRWNNIKIDMNYLTQVKHHTAVGFVTENSVGKTVRLFMKKLILVKKLLLVGFVTNTLLN